MSEVLGHDVTKVVDVLAAQLVEKYGSPKAARAKVEELLQGERDQVQRRIAALVLEKLKPRS